MPSANQEVARRLSQMAQVLEILGGDRFRINAFEKAARVLEELDRDIASIGPDLKKLQELPGIGKGMASRIAEYLTTGHIRDCDQVLARVPSGLIELLDVPGLGPKTIALFWRQAGITGLADLKAKLQSGNLGDLPGIGPRKIEILLKGIEFLESTRTPAPTGDRADISAPTTRVRLGQALPLARWFVEQLGNLPGVRHVDYAGSLRRGKETIGDLDLLVAAEAKDTPAIMQAFLKLRAVMEPLAQGPTKTSVRVKVNGQWLQVDLRVVPPQSYGAALMYFTGSKEHNVALRERALKRGLRLNEYALAKSDDPAAVVAATTENDIYRALDLDFIPPELREDRGEIDLAAAHSLPALLRFNDIRAELHTHTTASDGVWSIEEMARACAERGFHTVAVTDHSKSQPQAGGLNAQRLEDHILAVRTAAKKLKNKITILAGSEVDILPDGGLDYPDSLLAQLDIVVASPHASLSQEPAKATKRLLKAIENPYVTILAHPTGRMINARPGLSPDIGALIAAAAQRGIALEINANNHRLDLRDTHARAAIAAGVKLSINTDAHGATDLDELLYGVLTARRAGATASDVINCFSRPALLAWIKSTRP